MKYFAIVLTLVALLFGCKKRADKFPNSGIFQFSEVTKLPDIINESSGLEMADPFLFWSFNDGNGNPELYKFDTLGRLVQTLLLTNANNIDWEDITKDGAGNVYVGDFGNNDNDRQDLVIYIIPNPENGQSNNQVTATKIEFNYPGQKAFPPPESEQSYDVEAMFSKGSNLYLLTRDRSKPFVGKTDLYRLPNVPGIYEAKWLGEFFTDTKKSKGQITAADLSPDGSTLAMISDETLWLFQNIVDEDYFGGEISKLDLPVQVDMEGIVFQDNCTIYMSNENKSNNPAALHKVTICR